MGKRARWGAWPVLGRCFLVGVLVGVLGAEVHPAAGATVAVGEPTFSVEAVNAPLGKVLDRIGEQTGFRLELGSEWADEPVTAHLVETPLGEGLARLLGSYNHYLVTDLDRRTVKVRILGVCDSLGAANRSRPSSPPQIRAPALPTPTSGTLLIVGGATGAEPDADVGGPGYDDGLTAAEATGIDPADVEVVPPSEDGTPAPTPRALEEEAARAPPLDLSRVELVPPGHE